MLLNYKTDVSHNYANMDMGPILVEYLIYSNISNWNIQQNIAEFSFNLNFNLVESLDSFIAKLSPNSNLAGLRSDVITITWANANLY